MSFNSIAIVFLSLGVYATGELCVDSPLNIKTESGGKSSCLELIDKGTLDCLQPDVKSHCRSSCEVSFCCADSRARVGVVLPGTNQIKYKTCSWKALIGKCDTIYGLSDSCPVMCGTCDPVHELFQIIGDMKSKTMEDINGLKSEVTEDINSLKSEVMEDIDGLKSGVTENINLVKSVIGDVKSKTMEDINGLKIEVKEDINGLKSVIGDVKSKTMEDINDLKSGVTEDINGLKSKVMEDINNLESEVMETIHDQGKEIDDIKIVVTKQGATISVLEAEVNIYAYKGYVYKPVLEDGMFWEDYEAAAVAWGGHLASIHSAEEKNFIANLLNRLYSGKFFFLGVKKNAAGVFENVDGTDLDYTNWHPNQPSNSNGIEDVVELWWMNQYTWNDIPHNGRIGRGGIYKKSNPTL